MTGASLHARILADLQSRITSQKWNAGFKIPAETELAESFGVSRMTMNKVLTEMVRKGYLTRRRKLGTVVAMPRGHAAVMEITDIEAEVRALQLDYAFACKSIKRRKPSPAEWEDIGPVPGQVPGRVRNSGDVLFIRGLHMAGGQPFCLENRIINPEMAPGVLQQDFARESPGKWLVRQVPWSAARHVIRAMPANAAVAQALGIAPGSACLEVTRRTETQGQWVTLVKLTYPGDRHQVVAQFEPH